MNLKLVFSDFINTPLKYAIPKIMGLFATKSLKNQLFKIDSLQPSNSKYQEVSWVSVFSLNDILDHKSEVLLCEPLVGKYMNHRFDILGSNWAKWTYNYRSTGFMGFKYTSENQIPSFDTEGNWLENIINDKNLTLSKKLWSKIIDINPNYNPINWNLDARSGYQYDSKTHFSKIKVIPGLYGVDVKVPWELGRLQHLPMMAILYASNVKKSIELLGEIKCQLLDFIMSNPPRWGVQWTSAMDVSIRVMNVIMTMDVLIQSDISLKETDFYKIVVRSIQDHVSFAWDFREHKNGLSNNHFLANLLGIMYGAYAIQDNNEYKVILDSSVQILINELDKQFLNDGGNFESSLPYHFFASEIGILSLSLIRRYKSDLGKDRNEKFAVDIQRVETKLKKAMELCNWSIINEGHIAQIGDNDSARIIYWTFPYSILSNEEYKAKYQNISSLKGNNEYIDRDYLDYTSTNDMIASYFGGSETNSIHTSFIKSILKKNQYDVKDLKQLGLSFSNKTIDLKYEEESIYDSNNSNIDLRKGMKNRAFEEIGLYFFKGEHIFLVVNGMNRKVRQYWPHSHNDKLSMELWIDGNPIIRDPGSFVYTALPDERNKYRSIKAHATIIFNNTEQNDWIKGIQGVFRTKARTKVELLSFGNDFVKLRCSYKKYIHEREISIEKDRILVRDCANYPFMVNKYPNVSFSNGYGKISKTN